MFSVACPLPTGWHPKLIGLLISETCETICQLVIKEPFPRLEGKAIALDGTEESRQRGQKFGNQGTEINVRSPERSVRGWNRESRTPRQWSQMKYKWGYSELRLQRLRCWRNVIWSEPWYMIYWSVSLISLLVSSVFVYPPPPVWAMLWSKKTHNYPTIYLLDKLFYL